MGRNYMVSSGHYLATQAALRILDAGGNAIDAGVAAGLAINVCQTDMTNLGGVAPIMIHLAGGPEVLTISGLGCWPRAADIEAVVRLGQGGPRHGLARTVVPAAVDAWLTALARYGTMSLATVAAPAIELAADGFAMYGEMVTDLRTFVRDWFDDLPTCRDYFLPNGRLPAVGEVFRQPALARTLLRLVDAEAAATRSGRAEAIMAARDLFYRGEIAREIAAFHQDAGGLLRYDDLAEFGVITEPAVHSGYRGYQVYACGPWSQGPVVPQTLNILEGFDIRSSGPGTAATFHLIAEALKLAFSDRHTYYGDPLFVDVPIDTLLDKDYAATRRQLLDPDLACPQMPPAGDVSPFRSPGEGRRPADPPPTDCADEPDTSYVCVVDRAGNGFSATPSDAPSTPMIPELGIIASSRGYQSWVDPEHPSAIAPGKRPRLTPSPGMVLRDGRLFTAYGAPGNDRQSQAMVQYLINVIDFSMEPQEAVEAPRIATFSMPASGHPHRYYPGLLRAEPQICDSVRDQLTALGHRVQGPEPSGFEGFGTVCAIEVDADQGVLRGAADPRRCGYAMGW